jgi:hypothetical protein
VSALKTLADLLSNIIRDFSKGNDPSEKIVTVSCPDPGLEHGGIGNVEFKVHLALGFNG